MRTLDTERRETVDGVDVRLVYGSPLAVNDSWWGLLSDAENELRVAGPPPRSSAAPTPGWPGAAGSPLRQRDRAHGPIGQLVHTPDTVGRNTFLLRVGYEQIDQIIGGYAKAGPHAG